MTIFGFKRVSAFTWKLALLIAVAMLPSRGWAISANQLDDFQNGSQGWSINNGATEIPVIENEGPAGDGDFALYMSTTSMGVSRLLVLNVSQWTGDWTAAGIAQVSLAVRNPNAFNLSMRLGIAGRSGQGPGGSGDTYVTNPISVPPDDGWHELTFNVEPADFVSTGGTNAIAALADVGQLRVIHNPSVSFTGASVQGAFYLDNIRALVSAVSGDYNGNRSVDAADYVVWRKSLNQAGFGLPADGTGPGGTPDGVVNELDYQFWRARFGNPSPAAGSFLATTEVPEPSVCFLALIVFVVHSRHFWPRKPPL